MEPLFWRTPQIITTYPNLRKDLSNMINTTCQSFIRNEKLANAYPDPCRSLGVWVLELKRHCSPCGQIRTPLRTGYRPTPSLLAAPTGHRQPSEFTAKARFNISLHHPEGSVYSSCSIQDKRRAWCLLGLMIRWQGLPLQHSGV